MEHMEGKFTVETDFSRLLGKQALQHPSVQPQDIVKLCYQAAFGAEHLLADMDGARSSFFEEFEESEPDVTEAVAPGISEPATALTGAAATSEESLYEILSSGFCRVNLRAWKRLELPGEWLFKMFVLTAQSDAEAFGKMAGDGTAQDAFWDFVHTARSLIKSGIFPFSEQEWDAFWTSYEAEGVRPLHHSGEYRRRERPAYRIIKLGFVRLIPVLLRMTEPAADREAFVVAMDGRSASGKTTLGAELEAVTGAGIIHMDDFFLPPELRTAGRFSQPGGNVHYERFRDEVLPGLSHREAFSYTKFDCGKMEMGEQRQVAGSRWRIVEGAYSLHPALGKYMDLRVFCDVEPEEQLRRIRKRNGEEAAAVFAGKWIPMEEEYFRAYNIEASADLVL